VATPNLSKDAIDFVRTIQPKHAKQILLKVIALCSDSRPTDAQPLKNSPEGYWRADVGEYRIIYRVQGDVLEVPLIGKRNDDEVYKCLSRR
jgi:mRNA interferase RelE/StbE